MTSVGIYSETKLTQIIMIIDLIYYKLNCLLEYIFHIEIFAQKNDQYEFCRNIDAPRYIPVIAMIRITKISRS